MIKAIIFDFFGVISTRGLAQFRRDYVKGDDAKNKQIRKLKDLLNIGQIGYDDFIDGLVKISGASRDTVLGYTEEYQPNSELLDYIRAKLKSKYKIGIISNSGADWVEKIIGDDKRLFDDIVLSYQTGHTKPDAEIYQLSVKNLGVKPGECVFIDDIRTYCEGAEKVGMESIWYRGFEGFKRQLEELLPAVPDN